ncbi:MAG: hypothetical protein GY796_20125 [Chloroflexi bacterium]|nr:hypothetical protein [Chloroflexota bacterium]
MRNWRELITRNGFLGAMVALLTVFTAATAYLGSEAEISGDDLDNNTQNNLVLASAAYLDGNMIALKDMALYEGYILNEKEDPALAGQYLNGVSPELLAELEEPGPPFTEAYFEIRYAEATRLLAEAEEMQEQGDHADKQALRYQLTMLIFAFGLAMIGWASLADSKPGIVRLFVFFALFALISGITSLIFALTA